VDNNSFFFVVPFIYIQKCCPNPKSSWSPSSSWRGASSDGRQHGWRGGWALACQRTPETPLGRWRAYNYDERVVRDKTSLDIFWLKDDTLADSDNLPPPKVIAQEIVEGLQAALEQLKLIADEVDAPVAAD